MIDAVLLEYIPSFVPYSIYPVPFEGDRTFKITAELEGIEASFNVGEVAACERRPKNEKNVARRSVLREMNQRVIEIEVSLCNCVLIAY